MAEFTRPIRRGEKSDRVADAQFTLAGHNRFHRDFRPGGIDRLWGGNAAAAADQARYELGYPLRYCSLGTFGQQLYDYLRPDGRHEKLPPAFLARRSRRHGRVFFREVVLPRRVSFPNQAYPPPTRDVPPFYGLQPWIWPQVEAICKHFDLHVTDGWGGSPPHARFSDHRWAGAVDLAGDYDDMVACTIWADGLKSGFYRRGKVFRWVGGPAHDADGVEHGHGNHVHLSWFRFGPATTIFGTKLFPRV